MVQGLLKEKTEEEVPKIGVKPVKDPKITYPTGEAMKAGMRALVSKSPPL